MLVLKVVKRLLDAGVSLQNIRVAVEHLRRRGIRDLAGITLFSDGTTVYECASPEEVVDLLQGGQGVFGIAVGGAMREISGIDQGLPGRAGRRRHRRRARREDELSRRRARRRSADRIASGRGRSAARSGEHTVPAVDPGRVADPARESPGAHEPGAEGANPPRNLSGTRTARVRRLWKATAHRPPSADGESPRRSGG